MLVDGDAGSREQVPSISDDGRYVTTTEYGTGGEAVYLLDTSTGTRQLANPSVDNPDVSAPTQLWFDPVVSGDGKTVGYTTVGEGMGLPSPGIERPGVMTGVLFDTETSVLRMLPVPADHHTNLWGAETRVLDLSFDGTRVLYSFGDMGSKRLMVADTTTEPWTVHTLVRHSPPSQLDIGGAQISGNGQTVVSYLNQGPCCKDPERLLVHDLPAVGAAAEEPNLRWSTDLTDLTKEPPAISGDGQTVVWTNYVAPTKRIFVRDLANSETSEIALPDGAHELTSDVALSADGSTLVFGAEHRTEGSEGWDAVTQLYSMNRASGQTVQVTVPLDNSPPDADRGAGSQSPDVNADGSAIVFRSGDTVLVRGAWGPVMLAKLSDQSPPSWPSDASLRVVDIGATFARVEWDEAVDDIAVAGYRVYVDGTLAAEPAAADRSVVLTELTPQTSHLLAVEAIDGAGAAGPRLTATATTTAVEAGAAALTAAANPDGTVTLSWDPATGDVEGYRVYRDTVAGWVILESGPTGTGSSHIDAGVPASSTVHYRVAVVRGGAELPHTVPATTTTPAIPAPQVSWTAPRMRQGELVLGGTVEVIVQGQPFRHGEVRIDAGAPSGPVAGIDIALTETEPGVYSGSAVIPAGIAVAQRLTARLHDGAGHQTSTSGRSLPAPVSGAITVNFDTRAPLDGSILDISSAATTSATRLYLQGTGPVTIPVRATGDHQLIVWLPDGAQGAKVAGLSVAAGNVVPVTAVVRRSATLNITVVTPDGTPLRDADVAVRAEGSPNATKGRTGSDGYVKSNGWDDRMDAAVTVTSRTVPLQSESPTIRPLAPGENSVRVVATPVPTATATVRATLGGVPAREVYITVQQVISGVPVSRQGRTGSDGTATITGFAGPATISATGSLGTAQARDIVLPAGLSTVDVEITELKTSIVVLDLRTRGPGDQDWGPTVGVDWSTAIHLRVHLELISGTARMAGSWVGSQVPVHGVPGSQFRVCADAREAGGAVGCSDVLAVPVSPELLPASLRLESRAGLRTRLVSSGSVGAVGAWTANVSGNGLNFKINGNGEDLRFDVAAVGTYRVLVAQLDPHLPGGRGPWTTVSFTLGDGVTDMRNDPILLGVTGTSFQSVGNSLTALRTEVSPGELIEFRTEYNAAAGHSEAALQLSLPPGWTSEPDGVTVNGVAAAAARNGGIVEIPIGAVAARTAGSVRIVVRVAAGAAAGVDAVVSAQMATGAVRHWIGSATVRIAGISISGPHSVAAPTAVLSGRAPAGTTVTIHEAAQEIGIAVAGPDGHWEVRVDLPDRPIMWEHRLHAVGTVEDQPVSSSVMSVLYDPGLARLQSATVNQAGRTVQFDVTDGVARFPFTITNEALTVTLRFDKPSQVTSAEVTVGSLLAPATRKPDGTFTATMDFSMGQEGPIAVEFESDRTPTALNDFATISEADLIDLLPVSLQNYETVSVTEVSGSEGHGAAMVANLPALAGSAGAAGSGGAGPRLEAKVTESEPFLHTPTAEEAGFAARMGLPIYSARQTYSVTKTKISTTVTVLVAVPEGATAAAQQGLRRVDKALATVSPQLVARLGFEVAFTGFTSADSILSAVMSGGKYDDIMALMGLIDQLEACGMPRESFDYQVESLMENALALDAFNAGTTVAGFVAGAYLPLLGTMLVWSAGWAADKYLSAKLDDKIRNTDRHLKELLEICTGPPSWRRPVADPIADPVYIYDPSGYVFEAIPGNRLSAVTSTVLYSPSPNGPWQVWEAEWFGQSNPVLTDADGRYGWDVPPGYWRVRYEKDGYLTEFSEILKVLPPHFDVNVGLVSTRAPKVATVSAVPASDRFDPGTGGASGRIEITFDQPVLVDWVGHGTVDIAGTAGPLDGQFAPVDAATAGTGDHVATRFLFTPTEPLTPLSEVDVLVYGDVRNYADRPMGDDATFSITVAEPSIDPSETAEPPAVTTVSTSPTTTESTEPSTLTAFSSEPLPIGPATTGPNGAPGTESGSAGSLTTGIGTTGSAMPTQVDTGSSVGWKATDGLDGAAARPSADDPAGVDGQLSQTGFDVASAVWAAMLLMFCGAVLLLIRRNRRAAHR